MSDGGTLAVILGGSLALLGLLVVGVNELGRASCYSKAQIMRVDANYSFMTGCMVKHKGEWWPLKSIRSID